MNHHIRAYMALVIATVFWSGNYLLGKVAVASMSPFSVVFLRWALALPLLLLFAHVIEHPDWRGILKHWRFLALQGTLGLFAYNFLLYEALQTSSPFGASLINAANPALIALAASVLLHEHIGWRGTIGIVFALVGVLVVLTHGNLLALFANSFGTGDLLMLGVIVVWTAYTMCARKGPSLPPITQVAAQAGIMVCAMAIMAPSIGVTAPHSVQAWGSLAFIAIFPSCGSYILWNHALTIVDSARAGVFLNLITVFTVLGSLIIGTTITLPQIVGGIIIMFGVVLTTLPRRSTTTDDTHRK